MSSGRGAGLQHSEEMPSGVALETADRLTLGLALASSALDVGDRAWVVLASRDHDLVEDVVELAVSATVEAVADDLTGAGWDRRCSRQPREGGLAGEAAPVRPGDERLGSADWTDAALVEKRRGDLSAHCGQLTLEFARLGAQELDPLRQ